MEIGGTVEWNGVVYTIIKQIDDFTYEIQNTENGEVVPYAIGRPVLDKLKEM